MAAFFLDTFSSGSTLSGRTPDTPYASLTWVTNTTWYDIEGQFIAGYSAPSITGGYAYGTDTAANYGDATARSLTESFTLGWNFRTTGTVTTDYKAIAFIVKHGGTEFKLRLDAGLQQLRFAGFNEDYSAFASLATNTTYPGSLTYEKGSDTYTFSFLGVSKTWTGGLSPNTDGFTGLYMLLGTDARMESIQADPYVPPTGVRVTLGDTTAFIGGGGDVRYQDFPYRMDDTTMLAAGGGSLQTTMLEFYGLTSTGTGTVLGNNMVATIGGGYTLKAQFGGRSISALQNVTLRATAYANPNEFVAALGGVTFTGQFGLNAINSLPPMSFTGTGTSTVLGQVIGALGPITSVSAGTTGGLAQMIRTLAALPPLVSNSGAVFTSTLDAITVQSAGAGGGVGTIIGTLSRMTLESSGTRGNFGTMIQTLDSIQAVHGGQILGVLRTMTLRAEGHAVVAVTYEAYAINLNPSAGYRETPVHEVTRYTNYPFNQFIRHGNDWYGVADDGLHLLGGTTDHAVTPTKVPWAFNTAMTDFKSSQEKHVREVMVAGRLGSNVVATVSINEGANKTSTGQVVRGKNAKNNRVKYPRGLASRYWSFGFSGTAELELDALEFDEQSLTRKL